MEIEQEQVEQDKEEHNEEEDTTLNFGFKPLPEKEPEKNEEEEKNAKDPECIKLRAQICRILSRYPDIKLRTSSKVEQSLLRFNSNELSNIYTNCINDLQSIRGTPSADLIIYTFAGYVDNNYIPGYLEACLNDVELQRDIEGELEVITSWLGPKINIALRFLNNMHCVIYDRKINRTKRMREESPYVRPVISEEEEDGSGEELEQGNNKRTRTSY